MAEITAVAFVPKGKRGKLRHVLSTGDIGDLRWRERKKMFGSEFYFSGPSQLVMKTHEFVTRWIATPQN
jgi:hypothetical protein